MYMAPQESSHDRVCHINPSAACLVLLCLLTGCAAVSKTSEPFPWDIREYRRFVKDNRQLLNEIYSREYEPYTFVVDTATGSTVIQNLIDPVVVRTITETLALTGRSGEAKVEACNHFVVTRFRYRPTPSIWPTIAQTLESRSGDCKGLSLLLLSLLLSQDVPCYGAIASGHMWVMANVNGRWKVLETDHEPVRGQIYRIPGFYDFPLFKIYSDKTLKRRRCPDTR